MVSKESIARNDGEISEFSGAGNTRNCKTRPTHGMLNQHGPGTTWDNCCGLKHKPLINTSDKPPEQSQAEINEK